MDILYGLLISFVFIVVSVWSVLKLWDIVERDLQAQREPDQKQQLRHGVRDRSDGWGDAGGFGGGDGGAGGA